MRRLPALLALSTMGAMSLGGCGGSPSYHDARGGVLRVTLDEYRLRPESFVMHAGRVRIVATNAGRLTHNLTIETFDPALGEEPKVYGRTDTLHPGERGTEQKPIVLKPGKYRLTCTIGNHDDLGQFGELKVVK